MNFELKIKNFKRIKEEITLKDFAYVNYLVGENGSGKTSVLNSISFLKDGGNSRHFFGSNSIVQLTYDDKKQFLFWNEDNPNRTEDKGNLNPDIFVLISNTEGEKGSNNLTGKANFSERIWVGDKPSLEKFNVFLEENGLDKIIAKKFIDSSDPFNQDSGRLIFENENGTIEPSFIADGLRAKHNLKSNLINWIKNINNPNIINLFLIEEPENNLHPNLQKEIPQLLNSIFENLSSGLAKNIFFFISTHSPFIISSSAKYENQKVYPLKNGKPLTINFQKHSWVEDNYSNGYSGAECAFVVSKMLGAEITDMGYPENYCILEEFSLQKILDDVRDKGIIKNFQFLSASGVTKSLSLAEKINELEKLNTLIKCNPYYWDKYLLIVDNTANINDGKLKDRVQKISSNLQNRFIELSLDSLEDYYFNIDTELAQKAKEEIASQNKQTVGKSKAFFASQISEKIKDSTIFSKLFNGELDCLIKYP